MESMEDKTDAKPKGARRPRKKLSVRKRIVRPKRRVQKIGVADNDVAECLFSDEEMRADYLDEMQELATVLGKGESISEQSTSQSDVTTSTSLTDQSEGTVGAESKQSDSRPSSVLSEPCCSFSRPSSALSRPCSSLSRPPSSITLSEMESMNSDFSAPSTPCPTTSKEESDQPAVFSPTLAVIESGIIQFRRRLPSPWQPIASHSGFHLLLLSPGETSKAIQREVFIPFACYSSEVISVHCEILPFAGDILSKVANARVNCEENLINEYCDRAIAIVKSLMQYDICVGANHEESRSVWMGTPLSYVDKNPYKEQKYAETCRSSGCFKLIPLGKLKRCAPCAKVLKSLRKRCEFLGSESIHENTPNIFLTHEQALEKLKQQQKVIKTKDKKIARLSERIEALMESEGVELERDISEDLSDILSQSDLSPVQKMFLEQQLSCAGKADARSHRWHPTMIRLALHLKMVSASAYEALRDSGAVKLPSSRTLFDYSRAITPQEGVSDGILNLVREKIFGYKKHHQKFVALLCDEIHVSQNLVYRQSDGCLVGYTHLEEVDKEVMNLDTFVKGEEPTDNVQLANKVLAFLVKGLTSDVKCVVAAFPCNQLTKDMLYSRAWNVISRLERSGVKVLAITCDGSSVNRSFFNMHTPLTVTKSGVVFDTLNICSPDSRPLYFIADVAHLIKTIRNCFYNSGEGEKKTRCLEYNGEKIVWSTIVRLYLKYKQCTFRKSYKLNAQNVFPNSYSCMKVKYAAQILSDTVALDIEQQKWPNTTETVKFLRKCNKFFDCLNGAHSSQSVKTRNENLAPFTHLNDQRFEWLYSFLDYFEDWKDQVKALKITPTDKAKKMLSHQTVEGIEIAIRGIEGAIKYMLSLLDGPAQFIMARVFSQDPLEQHFSKQRAAGGGSHNPNVSQFQSRQVGITLQRDLGVRHRRANVEDGESGMQVTSDPLPKRRRKTTKKGNL